MSIITIGIDLAKNVFAVHAYFAERDRSFRGSVTGGGMMNAWW